MSKKQIRFVSFDGPDGLGKSTQLNLFKKALEEKGSPIHSTRLLGGDGTDDFQLSLRKVLLHSKFPKDSVALEEQMFALCDLEGIRAAKEFLKNSAGVVLKDRAIGSHVAYAYAKKMKFPEIFSCHAEVIRETKNINHEYGALDLLFIPDDVEWLLERIRLRNAKTGEAIVERLENRDTQVAVCECLERIPSMVELQDLNFEIVRVSKEDSIADVAQKVLNVLNKYELVG